MVLAALLAAFVTLKGASDPFIVVAAAVGIAAIFALERFCLRRRRESGAETHTAH